MAVPFSALDSITRVHFMPKVIDNFFNSNALFQKLRKGGSYQTISGGTKIAIPVAFASTTASGWYTGSETLDTDANQQITRADFDWKQEFSTINISGLDEIINSGDDAVVNYVSVQTQLAEKTMTDKMGTALFNIGTAAKELIGLRLAVDQSRTYGGINSSTNTFWDAQEDSSSTSLSIPNMRSLMGDCTIGSDRPDMIIADQDRFDEYYGLLQPAQRFTDSDTANAGFKNLMFDTAPFIVDSHCPSDHLFMLNTKYIMLKYHKDRNFKFVPFQQPVNQDVAIAKILWAGAFCISNPRMQGKFSALA